MDLAVLDSREKQSRVSYDPDVEGFAVAVAAMICVGLVWLSGLAGLSCAASGLRVLAVRPSERQARLFWLGQGQPRRGDRRPKRPSSGWRAACSWRCHHWGSQPASRSTSAGSRGRASDRLTSRSSGPRTAAAPPSRERRISRPAHRESRHREFLPRVSAPASRRVLLGLEGEPEHDQEGETDQR